MGEVDEADLDRQTAMHYGSVRVREKRTSIYSNALQQAVAYECFGGKVLRMIWLCLGKSTNLLRFSTSDFPLVLDSMPFFELSIDHYKKFQELLNISY